MLKFPAVLTHDEAAGFSGAAALEISSAPKEVVVDASLLQQFDSSALAILLDCWRQALAAGKSFTVVGAPERLLQLAQVYGVAELISAADASPAPAAA